MKTEIAGTKDTKQTPFRPALTSLFHVPRASLLLFFCLAFALAIRIWLTIHTHGVVEADESLVGIQAEHILRGERPIYFYNQVYMGSLEAYIMAALFAILGPSVWTLRLEAMLISLLIVWFTWLLANELAIYAKLSPYARRFFTTLAALFAAFAPLYDLVIELRTNGGYIETFALMLLLLYLALRLTRRWGVASPRELALYWAAIGLIVGVGFWVYPLISSAVLAAAIWILSYCIVTLFIIGRGWFTTSALPTHNHTTIRGRGKPVPTDDMSTSSAWKSGTSITTREFFAGLVLSVVAIPLFFVGFSPALYWGANNQWQNISYIIHLGSGSSSDRLATTTRLWNVYSTCVAPRVIGGALPIESQLLLMLHNDTFLASIACLCVTLALAVLSLVWWTPVLVQVRRLTLLPLLFASCTALAYCTSSASLSALGFPCSYDFTGRYATPLALALPLLLAVPLTFVVQQFIAGIRASNALSDDRTTSTRSAMAPDSRTVRATTLWSTRILQGCLLLLVVAYLGIHLYTYRATDSGATMQSPYCNFAPAHNEAIIDYMQREHIHYAWATNFLAYPIDFKTNGGIIVADPLPLLTHAAWLNRLPLYTAAVQKADRPSMLVFTKHGNLHPYLVKMLDQLRVTYREASFPSQTGVDVLVITPLNRTFSPLVSTRLAGSFQCQV